MAMGLHPERKLRLGRISFLNVLPLYYPLESGIMQHPFELVNGTPSFLNGLMASGDLDVSVVSSIEYARHPESYFIVPDLSISCRGAVESVLLLSRVPPEQLGGERIVVTGNSHTSVALLKALLASIDVNASMLPGDCLGILESGERPTALLTIGDEALRLSRHPDYPFRVDLGQAWHDWTGLPFVFALWVVRRDAVGLWNGMLDRVVSCLGSAKQWGMENIESVCTEALRSGVLGLSEFRHYYSCLGYDLGADEVEGLQRFYQCLAEAGDIDGPPGLEFYPPSAADSLPGGL